MPPKEEKKDEKKDEKEEKKDEKKKDEKEEKEEKKDDKEKEGAEGETKEAEGETKEGTKKKECKGEPSCVGKGVASGLSAPQEGLNGIKQMLDAQLIGAGKFIATTLTNPVKCVAGVAGAVPNIFTGIFDAFASGIDKVSNSVNKLGENAEAAGFDDIFAPFNIIHVMLTQNLQNIILNLLLGPEFFEKNKDKFNGMKPNEISDFMIKEAMKRTNIINKALEDAETRGIIKKTLSEYKDDVLKTLTIAQPEIDEINNKLKSIIEGFGSNIGDATGHALTNVIVSLLGALPIVGGLASGINALDQLGKKLVDMCEPIIVKGAGIMMPIVNGVNKEKSKLECEMDNLANQLKVPIERLEAKLEGKSTQQSGGGRGGCGSKKKIQKKIHMTQKRVAHLLNRFTRRKHKTNYTRRLMRSRF